MDTQEILHQFENEIINVYNKEGLTCLSGLDRKYILNGKNILIWHGEVVPKAAQHNKHFSYAKNEQDILFCSDELLYFTACLYLYRPYINSPLKDAFPSGKDFVYPNFQNKEGKRFNMIADVVCQVAYDYWDRIGDLVASFFPEKLDPKKVFFTTALDAVPEQFRSNDNFSWLMEFMQNGYKELNEKRKKVVHYSTSNTDFMFGHLESVHDKEAIEELQKQREELPEFYKHHISLTLEGYGKTLQLLSEISTRLYS